MKGIFYVLFSALVFLSAVYVLKPDDEPPEIGETPKQERPVAAKPENKPPHEAVKDEKPMPPKAKPTPNTAPGTSAKQGALPKATEGLAFDSSDASDFSPFSPPEDDGFPPFGDLSTEGFGDDDLADDDFFTSEGFLGEGEGWQQLDSGELKGKDWERLDSQELR